MILSKFIRSKSKLFIVVGCVAGSVLLTSCYAFLQADKLVYAGTVAKKPAKTLIVNDSIIQTHD